MNVALVKVVVLTALGIDAIPFISRYKTNSFVLVCLREVLLITEQAPPWPGDNPTCRWVNVPLPFQSSSFLQTCQGGTVNANSQRGLKWVGALLLDLGLKFIKLIPSDGNNYHPCSRLELKLVLERQKSLCSNTSSLSLPGVLCRSPLKLCNI